MIEEPRVKVNTMDFSELASRVPDSLNLGMVIDSDDGPVGITRIDNQTEFIKKYLFGTQLNPTDSDTVKHAFKLLQFMPIYVTRAMDNSVFGGITNNGDTIFTDTDFNVMKYYKQLVFEEEDKSFDSVFMRLKQSDAFDYTSLFVYLGSAPRYSILTQVSYDEGIYSSVVDLPQQYDKIFDTETNQSYIITNISNGIATVAAVGDHYTDADNHDVIYSKPNTGTVKFIYSFGVNFKKKFTIPAIDSLYALSNIVKSTAAVQSNTYFTIQSLAEITEGDDEGKYRITLKPVLALGTPAGKEVNLLTMLTQYNASSGHSDLNNFFTISDSDGKLTVTISYKTTLVSLGYRLKPSPLYDYETPDYTNLNFDQTLESSKYSQFSGSSTDTINASQYLSLNGFTYFSNSDSCSNEVYPYVNVNFNLSSMDVCKFLTYIYDYQVFEDANIEPVSLETSLKLRLPSSAIIDIHGDFENKYIEGSEVDNNVTYKTLELLNNAKVSVGYITVKLNESDKYIFFVGYDTNPKPDFTVANSIYDDYGNIIIHSSGKMLYAINEELLSSTITSSGTCRILYSSKLLESVDNTTSLEGPKLAENNFKYSFLDDNSIIGNTKYEGLQLRIDDYLFYNKSYSTNNPDLIPVKISSSALTFMQFIKHLRRYVGNYFCCIDSENGLTLMTADPDEYSNIEWEGHGIKLVDQIDTNNAGIVDSAKFAIINKCPSKKKNLMFSLTHDPDDPELWTLVITRKVDETSYTISFEEDKVDGYGRNVYYTYVNQMDDYIHLVELNGDDPQIVGTYTSELFGNEVPIASPEPDDFVNAVNRFNDNVGVYYDFIFDGGYANLVFAKGIFEVCKNIYAEGLLTMPQITDYKQLIDYRETSGIDSDQAWRCIMRGNWINDTTTADFLIRMSPICAYVERIVNNKTGMKEFAPVFGTSNGSIAYEPGFYISKKNIREELLNHQIPVIVDDKSLNTRYWNLDLTLKKIDSSLSDVNNARMINIGAHICDNQCKLYIGRFNTTELRMSVTDALTNLLTDRLIKNQMYALAGLKVICNDTNNPVTVVENRELVVDVAYQFYPGIRYVNVFQRVYKLSQDLESL